MLLPGTRRVKSGAGRKPGGFTVKLDCHCARLSVLIIYICIFSPKTDYFTFNPLAFNVLRVVFTLTTTGYRKRKSLNINA